MVSTIGEGAFVACNALASITVDVGNQNYDSRDNCNAIIEKATNTLVAGCKNTVIPNAVTSIGDYALSINSLSWIEIPANVTSIGEEAFAHCTGLDSLIVHATTPPALGPNAFSNVDKTIPVYIPAGTCSAYRNATGWSEFTNLIDPANIVFADANVKALCVTHWDSNGDGELSYDEAEAVQSLGEVFKGNTQITSFDELQYFTNLVYIGERAFYNCTSLASVKFPDKFTPYPEHPGNTRSYIEEYAFYNCISLTTIEIPFSIMNIYNHAFEDCTGL